MTDSHRPEPFTVNAADSYPLRGFCWRQPTTDKCRPVVIVNAATSVRCRYYARFAAYLHRHGFDVITYDYRGIGLSRPASMRRFDTGWLEWGALDFEAMLQYALRVFPGQPVQVVGHSVGGFVMGLAPSNHHISRAFTMGAQFAHWRDYARDKRLRMLLRWHLVMPLVTRIFGYFPGERLGWLEDTPRGVVRDWTARHPRFEENFRRGARKLPAGERRALADRFAQIRAPILALGVTDDEFGTEPAVQRLLAYFRNCPTTHLVVSPEELGLRAIGHFAFFHSRFEGNLWPIALHWLRNGSRPADGPGRVRPLTANVR